MWVFSNKGLIVRHIKHANTHKYRHQDPTPKPCAISQLSAYSIPHPKSHYRVSTIVSLLALRGTKKQSRPHSNIKPCLVMNSTITVYRIEGPKTSSETSHSHHLRTVQQLRQVYRQSAIVSTPTSVMYNNSKVCVGGFVLWSFGGHWDDRGLGWILVGGDALLWERKKKKIWK